MHRILDKIEDEKLLKAVCHFLTQQENAQEGRIWQTLSTEQKQEVLQSFEESENEENLIPWGYIEKNFVSWALFEFIEVDI